MPWEMDWSNGKPLQAASRLAARVKFRMWMDLTALWRSGIRAGGPVLLGGQQLSPWLDEPEWLQPGWGRIYQRGSVSRIAGANGLERHSHGEYGLQQGFRLQRSDIKIGYVTMHCQQSWINSARSQGESPRGGEALNQPRGLRGRLPER
jgi:hypothetical protein